MKHGLMLVMGALLLLSGCDISWPNSSEISITATASPLPSPSVSELPTVLPSTPSAPWSTNQSWDNNKIQAFCEDGKISNEFSFTFESSVDDVVSELGEGEFSDEWYVIIYEHIINGIPFDLKGKGMTELLSDKEIEDLLAWLDPGRSASYYGFKGGQTRLMDIINRVNGIKGVTSQWTHENGNRVITINQDMIHNAVQVTRNDSKVTVTVYAQFNVEAGQFKSQYGGTENYSAGGIKSLIEEGIMAWAGSYTANGTYDTFGKDKTLKVEVKIIECSSGWQKNHPQQRVAMINFKNGEGPPETSLHEFIHTKALDKRSGSYINLFSTVSSPYYVDKLNLTRDEFIKVVSHEFGHFLGIGDAYAVKPPPRHTAEVRSDDLMWGVMSPNDEKKLVYPARLAGP
ncbi:hypothetical protein LJC34_07055, partial [Oscillospiraceae bacterium OttesenSCG-928-G22]|nr:hypothetical protein [Oscillospiraceae bacterium OttesenSCG-928-G22]